MPTCVTQPNQRFLSAGLPTQHHCPTWISFGSSASVAAAIAKRRERSFYVPAATLSAIAGGQFDTTGLYGNTGLVGGSVPREFWNAIDKGAHEAADRGVLAGYPVLDVKVTLTDGSFQSGPTPFPSFWTELLSVTSIGRIGCLIFSRN